MWGQCEARCSLSKAPRESEQDQTGGAACLPPSLLYLVPLPFARHVPKPPPGRTREPWSQAAPGPSWPHKEGARVCRWDSGLARSPAHASSRGLFPRQGAGTQCTGTSLSGSGGTQQEVCMRGSLPAGLCRTCMEVGLWAPPFSELLAADPSAFLVHVKPKETELM